MRSKDYSNIKDKFRPGHADYTYFKKYGIRDYRGGGRSSARETAARVAAGAIAKLVLQKKLGKKFNVIGAVTQLGILGCDTNKWNEYNSPMKRNVTLDDVGGSAVYLLSDMSTGVSGETHHVDCGYHVVGMKAIDAPDMTPPKNN